jgi:glycosyltransferase involved in cell wall biosynthesis
MSSRNLRIYTCTPVSFKGDHTFFSRESGLLSRGLRAIGMDSYAVMPLPEHHGDEDGLIRATMEDLQQKSWWRDAGVQAVVLFAWAMPEYTPIARAIKDSGAKLMLYIDSAGLWNPWSDRSSWFRSYWNLNTRTYGRTVGIPRFFLGTLRQAIPRLFAIPRLEHMALADVIGTGSPGALLRTVNYARTFGFGHITNRMVLSPPPIPEHFCYDGEEKRKRVVCVARWRRQDWAQKNPAILLSSLASFLARRPDYEALVVGRGATELKHERFYPAALENLPVRFVDAVPNSELPSVYKQSRISFCSSYHESFHLASFEAACCGCSIVALDSDDVPALRWLAETDGSLAANESPDAFAEALLHEAAGWDSSHRDPRQIAAKWTSKLWSSQAARRVMDQLGLRS